MIFPIRAVLKVSGKPVVLRANITALACKNICIPLEGNINLTIPVGKPEKTNHATSIYSFEKKVPTQTTWPGFKILDISVNKNSVTIQVKSENPIIKPDIFIESENGYRFGKPETSVTPNRLNATFILPSDIPKDTYLSEIPITITVTDGDKSIELKRSIRQKLIAKITPSSNDFSWFKILLAALTGGIILNFMPCVLPVLTLKLLQVTHSSGLEQSAVRNGFLYSAYGIVFSFFMIAVLTCLLYTSDAADE